MQVIGITDPFELIAKLKMLSNNPILKDYANKTALKMVTHLFSDAGKKWRTASYYNSKGRIIYNALHKEIQCSINGSFYFQVARNATIIKTIPQSMAGRVTDYIAKEAVKGRRATDIAEDIRNRFQTSTEANINLIARTEVSKTSTALTRARAEEIGLAWYIWQTSEDERVRSSHEHMKGVLVRWNEPPSPEKLKGMKSEGNYDAGCIYNCRCYAEPIISIDDIKFPAKVHYGGVIRTLTRAQFEQIF